MLSKPRLAELCVVLGKMITLSVYIFYPLFLLYIFIFAKEELLKLVLIPAVSFLFVSILRRLINAQRPYEKLPITPLYNKKTVGNSFPSRHTFSVFIIAFVTLYLEFWTGLVLFFIGLILAVTRVLCGVHFIKDVLVGFLIALVFGAIVFII